MDLSAWLEKQGVSTQAFAARIRISRQAMHKLLNGDNRPSLNTALAIERETGGKVPVDSWPKRNGSQ